MAVLVGSVSGIVSTSDATKIIGLDDALEALGLEQRDELSRR